MKKLLKVLKKDVKRKIVMGGLVLLGTLILIICIMCRPKKDSFSVISESSLKQVLEIDELSTLEYCYNSIAAQMVEDSEKVKYYVRYEGSVRLGIEFEDITFVINEEQKEIVVKLPEVKMIDHTVTPETMDFIFMKDKYETEVVTTEALKLCKADLENKAKSNSSLFRLARENAVSSIKALLCPWIEQIDAEYVVTVE